MRFLLGLLGALMCFARDGSVNSLAARGKAGVKVVSGTSNLGAETTAGTWQTERNATRVTAGKFAKGSQAGSAKGPQAAKGPLVGGSAKQPPGGLKNQIGGAQPNASHWEAPVGVVRSSHMPEEAMFHRPWSSQNDTRKQADWMVAMKAHSFGRRNETRSRPFMVEKEDGESKHRLHSGNFSRSWGRDGENASRDHSHTRGDRFRMLWNATRGDRSRMPWNVSHGNRSWSRSRDRPQMPRTENNRENGKYFGPQHQDSQDVQRGAFQVHVNPFVPSSPASASLPSASQTSVLSFTGSL